MELIIKIENVYRWLNNRRVKIHPELDGTYLNIKIDVDMDDFKQYEIDEYGCVKHSIFYFNNNELYDIINDYVNEIIDVDGLIYWSVDMLKTVKHNNKIVRQNKCRKLWA